MSTLFSTSYLPPVSYITHCLREEKIILERHEHFVKQTFRNRAVVAGANGRQNLIVPVHHEHLFEIPIGEVKIFYESNWQQIHWRSLVSAYRHSPYFDFYENDFEKFYAERFEFLFDFNLQLLKTIFHLLKIGKEILMTDAYTKVAGDGVNDLRNYFHPKKRNEKFDALMLANPHRQVFSERTGFFSDLSIVDLLFNLGPGSREYLYALM